MYIHYEHFYDNQMSRREALIYITLSLVSLTLQDLYLEGDVQKGETQ